MTSHIPSNSEKDRLASALQADAARIRGDISPALQRRIDGALARARQMPTAPRRREPLMRPWLAGSLSGIAVAAAVVLLVAQRGNQPQVPFVQPTEVAAESTPEYITRFHERLTLRAETADLTAPLEKELENLQSDVEKARENLERDLRLTF
ncbi:MAG TPA: hypothetical protein VMO24_03105 [Woeseiaceae bacterium]|nr:hypothetical protein [Woeseiaceae bacterium]